MTIITAMGPRDLDRAYNGSWCAILDVREPLEERVESIKSILADQGFEPPVEWFTTTGTTMNSHFGLWKAPYQPDLVILVFPRPPGLSRSEMDVEVSTFKYNVRNRWFDDSVEYTPGWDRRR
jgi:hypothetical protein